MIFYYDDIRIKKRFLISGGCFETPNNGVILITGRNGSGKTLLLKNIFGNEKNSEYRIEYVDQYNNSVINSISVLKNISMSDDLAENKTCKEKIDDWGFGYLLDKKSGKMSGGEKRVVSLLRGFVSEFDVLMVDEPTNDLDYSVVSKILDIIDRISKDHLIIIVSHDDRVIERFGKNGFKVEEKKLSPMHSAIFEEKTQKLIVEPKPKPKKIPRRTIIVNTVSIGLTLLFLFFSCIVQFGYIEELKNQKEKTVLGDNQINLYHPVSLLIGLGRFSDVYPISIVNLFNETNMLKQIELYDDILDDYEQKSVTYDLKLFDEEGLTVYPMEFFDPIEKTTYFTMDLLLSNLYGVTSDKDYIDTDGLFAQPRLNTEDKTAHPFDKTEFNKCVDYLTSMTNESGRNLELVCVVVVAESETKADEFLKSEYIKSLGNSITMISTNKIIDEIHSINSFKLVFESLLKVFICWAIVVVCDLAVMVLKLKNDRGAVFILKNHGFGFDVVHTKVAKWNNVRCIKLILWALAIGACLVISRENGICAEELYIPVFVSLLCSFGFSADSLLIKKTVEKLYSWRAR